MDEKKQVIRLINSMLKEIEGDNLRLIYDIIFELWKVRHQKEKQSNP